MDNPNPNWKNLKERMARGQKGDSMQIYKDEDSLLLVYFPTEQDLNIKK